MFQFISESPPQKGDIPQKIPPPESSRLYSQAEKPFQSKPPHPYRRPRGDAGNIFEKGAYAPDDRNPELL